MPTSRDHQQPVDRSWHLGFRTQREEAQDVALDPVALFPDWLNGTFLSNEPGQFEVGETMLTHWFDALAMLRGVRFDDWAVRYTNRFVRSADFRVAREEQRKPAGGLVGRSGRLGPLLWDPPPPLPTSGRPNSVELLRNDTVYRRRPIDVLKSEFDATPAGC